jgi:hypothetical protein
MQGPEPAPDVEVTDRFRPGGGFEHAREKAGEVRELPPVGAQGVRGCAPLVSQRGQVLVSQECEGCPSLGGFLFRLEPFA